MSYRPFSAVRMSSKFALPPRVETWDCKLEVNPAAFRGERRREGTGTGMASGLCKVQEELNKGGHDLGCGVEEQQQSGH